MDLLAQSSTNIGNLRGLGPLGLEDTDPVYSGWILNRIISILLGIMTIFAGIWFMIMLITAAYSWMNSGGDKVALENARQKMMHAVVGIVIVIASIFVVDLVGDLLGFPFITDPAAFILYVITP